MLVAVVQESDYNSAKREIQKVLSHADGIELRLDYLESLDLEQVKKIRNDFDIPMIFTLRKQSQGGQYNKDESQRLEDIEALLSLSPDYFDLEYDVSIDFIEYIHNKFPKTKLICSYHNFEQTPSDLLKCLLEMPNKYFTHYKIATKANSTLDSLRMLDFINKTSSDQNIIGICMGELGSLTRILGPILGNAITYACNTEAQSVHGQLTLSTLNNIYNIRSLNQSTAIYALIGNPINKSIGHVFHNEEFHLKKQNAVYVKMQCDPEELPEFFQLLRKLPFKGLSVTMPLKEHVIPFLDDLDDHARAMNAVNTIVLKDSKLIGSNTDGRGALDAIESKLKVKDKHIVIIGAGGAAKAITYEAIKRGGKVTVLNRTATKAERLAKTLGCVADALENIRDVTKTGYDIMVNATSVGMDDHQEMLPIDAKHLIPGSVVMDIISKPKHTALIKAAELKGCICIYGEEMFINQALIQQALWKD